MRTPGRGSKQKESHQAIICGTLGHVCSTRKSEEEHRVQERKLTREDKARRESKGGACRRTMAPSQHSQQGRERKQTVGTLASDSLPRVAPIPAQRVRHEKALPQEIVLLFCTVTCLSIHDYARDLCQCSSRKLGGILTVTRAF